MGASSIDSAPTNKRPLSSLARAGAGVATLVAADGGCEADEGEGEKWFILKWSIIIEAKNDCSLAERSDSSWCAYWNGTRFSPRLSYYTLTSAEIN